VGQTFKCIDRKKKAFHSVGRLRLTFDIFETNEVLIDAETLRRNG
jgi:hypothetical protein